MGSTDPVSLEQANASISRKLPFGQLGLRCDQPFGTDFCSKKQRTISRANWLMCSHRQSCDQGLLMVFPYGGAKTMQSSHSL